MTHSFRSRHLGASHLALRPREATPARWSLAPLWGWLLAACQGVPALTNPDKQTPTLSLIPSFDTGASRTDRLTSSATLQWNVQGQASDTGLVTLTKNTLEGTVMHTANIALDSQGKAVAVFDNLADGKWSAQALLFDRELPNERHFSSAVDVTIDTTPPEPARVRIAGQTGWFAPLAADVRAFGVIAENSGVVTIKLRGSDTILAQVGSSLNTEIGASISSTTVTLQNNTSYDIEIVTADRAGNTVTTFETLVIGNAPFIGLQTTSDFGANNLDNVTNARILAFDVVGQVDTTYEIQALALQGGGTSTLATTTTNASGIAKVDVLSPNLSDGRYTIALVDQNTRVASTAITLDYTPPTAAAISIIGQGSGLKVTSALGPSTIGGFQITSGEVGGYYALTIGGVMLVSENTLNNRFNAMGEAAFVLDNSHYSLLGLKGDRVYDLTLTTFDLAGNATTNTHVLDAAVTARPLPTLAFTADTKPDANATTIHLSTVRDLHSATVQGDATLAGRQYDIRDQRDNLLQTVTLDSMGQATATLEALQLDASLQFALVVQDHLEPTPNQAQGRPSAQASYTVTVASGVDLAAASDLGASNSDNITSATTWQLQIQTTPETTPTLALLPQIATETTLMAVVTSVSKANSAGVATAVVMVDTTSIAGSSGQQDWLIQVTHAQGDIERDAVRGLVVQWRSADAASNVQPQGLAATASPWHDDAVAVGDAIAVVGVATLTNGDVLGEGS